MSNIREDNALLMPFKEALLLFAVACACTGVRPAGIAQPTTSCGNTLPHKCQYNRIANVLLADSMTSANQPRRVTSIRARWSKKEWYVITIETPEPDRERRVKDSPLWLAYHCSCQREH